MKLKTAFFSFTFFYVSISLTAQTKSDMLEGFEKKKNAAVTELSRFSKADTNRAVALAKVFQTAFFSGQKKQVMPYWNEAMQLSRKLNFSRVLSSCYYFMGIFYKSSLKTDSSFLYLDSCIALGTQTANAESTEFKAKALLAKAQIFAEKENYHTALNNYFESLKYFAPQKTNNSTVMIYSSVAHIYLLLGNYDKAIFYTKQNIENVRTDPDKEKITDEILRLIDIYLLQRDIPNTAAYLDSCKFYLKYVDEYFLPGYYTEKAGLFELLDRNDSAYYYYSLALKVEEKDLHDSQKAMNLYNAGQTALLIGKTAEAKIYGEKSLQIATLNNYKQKKINACRLLAAYYEKTGNYTKAYSLLNQSLAIQDSLTNEENLKQNNTLSAVYEYEKSQKEILQLQLTEKEKNRVIQQKSILNKILLGGSAAILLLTFLGYRNLRYRQKQKIIQLEKDAAEEKLKLTRLETEQFKNKFETEHVVNFFSNSLIDKSTVSSTMWDAAKNLIGTLGFEDCMMYLWNKDKTKMVQMAGYGPKGSIEEINKHIFDVMPGQGVVGHVMQTKQAILIPDTSLDARYRIDDMNRLSEITVPILYNNELIGIIDSENSAKHFFNERHLTILQTIAGMIAIKIKTIESETALQHTKIKLLQANEALQQKQLQAAEAMLKGQEEERGRLAKDLHDGLGGMLNGVKMSFNNIKENLIMTAENALVFEHSVKQLDATITELRKVSHNLMPDVLMRFGLTDALTDYCKSLANNNTDIAFQQMGEPRELSNTLKLYVYRIIQELTNNALKHSKAKEIIAQLTFEPAKILITVDDNGQGFNTAELINNKGVGMQSIKQRVDYLGGLLDIDSRPGKGTSVNIELNT